MDLQTIILIGILSLWLLYQIILIIFAKKKEIYNLIILLSFVAVFGFFYLTNKETENEYLYTFYFLISYLLISLFSRLLVTKFKRKISEKDYDNMEESIEEINHASELLRERFISTIEILYEGISFREADGSIYGSDKYIKFLGIRSNNFDVYEFEEKVYKDDLIQYKNTLEKTTKKKPVYNINYRIKNQGKIIWIKEVGKRIEIEKKITYISIIKPLEIKQFPETEIEVLNGLRNYQNMYEEMQDISRNKLPYNLVLIKLTNIPKINDTYGRDVGDLMMGEYLKKLQFNFFKDLGSMYRITGIIFGVIMKDNKKFEFLERALSGSGELLNLSMVFGGITQTLYPNLGIAESPYHKKTPDKMIEEAMTALKISEKEHSNTNYCFYDRI
jgi:diguanylate cyclase (GGDEF)-like protein